MDECGVCGGNGAPCFDYIQNIDDTSSQNYFNNYYYPVLPKLNKFGKFDVENLQGNRKPFGSNERKWNDNEDKNAVVTQVKMPNRFISNVVVDLDFSEINENSLVDLAGNKNYGIFINDYQIKFNEDNQPIKKKQPTRSKLGKSKKGKSF